METKMFKAHRGGVFDFRKRPRKWNPEVNEAMVINSSLGNKIPDYDTRLDIDLYITELKDIGVWSSLDTFVLFALNDTDLDDFSLYDYKRRTFYTAFGGVSYTPYGWEGNGVDGYLSSNFNPATMGINYTLNDARRGTIIYFSEGTTSSLGSIDSTSTGQANRMIAGNFTAQRINQAGNNLNAAVNLAGLGLTEINRDNDTDVRLIKGATESNRTAASTTVFSDSQRLLVSTNGFADLGLSTYYMGASRTFAQTQDFRTATNNYLTRRGLTPIA